ncbi:MAG: polysaccharide biosynthesis/export family protein [Gammaproteobacteria bacterium]|nr:polysaccharide biosynthesis/export family protein [Gammaproteobacteria bacterium]MDX2488263.1 polysaccharide biosynthesis/export family protein [Gammaproteobacteria bacterium]
MHNLRSILVSMILSISVAACSSTPAINQLPVDPATNSESRDVKIALPALTADEQITKLQGMTANDKYIPTLGRGDILNVSVYDEPDLTINSIPVRPDGHISFPLVGDVLAEGLSVTQLNEELASRLSRYILSPKVSVIVQEFNSQQFTIFGEVVRPGVFPLKTEISITDALAGAGGLNKGQFRATSVELADLTHAFIARNGEVLPVDFVRLIRQGDLRYDISLQSGDYIYIPSGLSKEVYILGEVNKPMLFAHKENMPMSRTLAQAEGFTPDADLKRIHILRGSLHNPAVTMINFKEVLAGNAREVALQPGDIVYVPPTGLTSFARVVDKIFPTIQALQVGIILGDTVSK